MTVFATLALLVAFSTTVVAVAVGLLGGLWLMLFRRARLPAVTGIAGALLIMWAVLRQYRLDAAVEAANAVGRWDAVFLPLVCGGVVLVVLMTYVFLAGVSTPRHVG